MTTSPTADSRPLSTVALVTLGCARNEVDSEELAGRLELGGFRLVDDASEAETVVDEASTVGEVLDGLYERFDGLRDRIAEDGGLRRFVNVYVGGEDIRFLDGLETSVSDGDEVTILPAVAGG